MVDCRCVVCDNPFQLTEWEVKRGRGRFCSRACYYRSRVGVERPEIRKRLKRTCPVCNTEFETGGRLGKDDKTFCSWECRYRGRYRSGEQANTLADVDAAYLAGLIDGEGSIFAYMRRDVVSIRLTITNTVKPMLEWVHSVTGVGGLCIRTPKQKTHSVCWFWQVNSEGAESVLKQIQPYIHAKGPQVALALDVQNRLRDPATKSDLDWQSRACERMRLLNKRGP